MLSREHYVLVSSSGCPALYARCPGSPCTPNFWASMPDVRLELSSERFQFYELAGCLFGSSSLAGRLGCAPDVRSLCFALCFLLISTYTTLGWMSGPCTGCPAYPVTYTATAIFSHTLYIALFPHGRGLTIHFEQTLEHISLSLSLTLPHQILDP